MSTKSFKTIEEQIALLSSRGLNIPDDKIAHDFLFHNNYYRISGYTLTLRDHDSFYPKANFQNVIDIYEFDHELRHILLKYLGIIEVTFKSIFAYEFSKKHGPTEYQNSSHFTNADKHREIMQKAEKQKLLRLPHEAYLKHFVDELGEVIPFWAYVDLLTISDISFLYSISEDALKTDIANAFQLNAKGDKLLEHFMHRMTIIRNLCAHGSRLYNRLFEQKPNLSKNEKKLLLLQPDGSVDNAHLYGYLLIMKRLLDSSSFILMKAEIICLSDKYPFIDMKYYGFRPDWKSLL